MPSPAFSVIYMIKKSAAGSLVSFRLGTDDGVRPGMKLVVVNEDGIRVGGVEVVSSTASESDALVAEDSAVKLGCAVRVPSPPIS